MRFLKPLRDPLAYLVVSAVTDLTSAAPLWAFRHFCRLALRSPDGSIPARALECGAALYNARLYFETHELLEEIWAEQPRGRDRTVLQGIIQAAAGLYHFQHANGRGGTRVLGYGLSKGEAGRPVFHGLAMDSFLDRLSGCRLAALAVLAGDQAAFPWETVPPMRFASGGEAP